MWIGIEEMALSFFLFESFLIIQIQQKESLLKY